MGLVRLALGNIYGVVVFALFICVLGSVEQATAKLQELESIGVDQFNIYLMTRGQEETLQAYGDGIIPRFTGVAA